VKKKRKDLSDPALFSSWKALSNEPSLDPSFYLRFLTHPRPFVPKVGGGCHPDKKIAFMILSKSLLIATLYLDPFKSYKGVSRLLSHPVYKNYVADVIF